MKEFIDKVSGVDGTKVNRANLMAAQGFAQFTYYRTNSGIEIEYEFDNGTANPDIETLEVSIENGQIIESYMGDKTITMITTPTANGYEAVFEE